MLHATIARFRSTLYAKSVRFVGPLEGSVRSWLLGWTIIAFLACALRVLFPVTPANSLASATFLWLPHVLIIASPFFAYWTANVLFPRSA